MAWIAKPSGAYGINSDEAHANMDMIYSMLQDHWTLAAICGMLGNFNHESGYNPWRWQGDTVNYSGGYGLAQFTPAKDNNNPLKGYIDGFGVGLEGYAPNMSVSQVQGGLPSDGNSQILAIDNNAGGKYTSYKRKCPYEDLSSVATFEQYKQCTDLWIATVGWLWYYEAPASENKTYDKALLRFSSAQICWEHFTEDPPIPPTPPPPSRQRKMPLWMYLRRL